MDLLNYYEYPVEEKEIEEDLLTKNTEVIDLKKSSDSTESIQSDETKSETIAENKDKVIYRVQIGYFEKDLSSNIFEGLNVIPVKERKWNILFNWIFHKIPRYL